MSETDAPEPGTAGFLPDGREGGVIRVWHDYSNMPNPVEARWGEIDGRRRGGWKYAAPLLLWDAPGAALCVRGWRYITRASDNPADVADAVGEGDVIDPDGPAAGAFVPGPDAEMERLAEQAFWDFDAAHKGPHAMSQRDAFKGEARGLYRAGLRAGSADRAALLRIIGEVELALAGTEPATEGDDAWGPLAMRVAGLVADDGGWETGPLPAGEAEGDEIETEENMDDDDRGGRHFWNVGRWLPAYTALGWHVPGDPVVRWRWLIRNGKAVR